MLTQMHTLLHLAKYWAGVPQSRYPAYNTNSSNSNTEYLLHAQTFKFSNVRFVRKEAGLQTFKFSTI